MLIREGFQLNIWSLIFRLSSHLDDVYFSGNQLSKVGYCWLPVLWMYNPFHRMLGYALPERAKNCLSWRREHANHRVYLPLRRAQLLLIRHHVSAVLQLALAPTLHYVWWTCNLIVNCFEAKSSGDEFGWRVKWRGRGGERKDWGDGKRRNATVVADLTERTDEWTDGWMWMQLFNWGNGARGHV